MSSDRDAQIRSWAETEADLRRVIAEVRIDGETERWVLEYLDHNELGLAFDLLDEALPDRAGVVARLMESARLRMGLPSRDIR